MMSTTLITGRPWRVILTFAIPLLIGNVVQQLYQFTDSIVVGRYLGVTSFAAVGASGSLLFLLLGLAWGMASGFAIPTAQAFGAGDERAVRRSVAAGTILSAAVTVVVTIIGPLLARPILLLLQTPTELLDDATVFAQVSFLGIVGTMFFNYLAAIIRAIGDSRTPLIFITIACALNVVLVILMVGPWGWGVAGAALSTVISQGFSSLLCLIYMWRKLPVLHVRREDWKVTGAELREHLRLGLPMGFQSSIVAIGTLIVQVALNRLGSDAVAAYTAASRVDSLGVAFLASLGLAASMYTAQNLGARRPDRIRRGVSQAVIMSITVAVVIGVLFIFGGAAIVRLFIGDGSDEVVDLAHLMLIINGSTYSLLATLFVLRGVLQGLGQALIPTITGAIELVARVIAAILLSGLWEFTGVAWSNPLAWFGAVVLLVPAYLKAHKRLAHLRVAPDFATETTPIAVIGPVDGSMVVDAVATAVVRVPKRRRSRR